MNNKINLVIGSTRQGRIANGFAERLVAVAKEAGIELGVLDLQQIDLPFYDAAVPPAYGSVDTAEAKAWAKQVSGSKGFVFLTPEYNRSISAPLKNALDFLFEEWNDKSAAIVSYGYVDGGAGAASHLKDILGNLKVKVVGKDMQAAIVSLEDRSVDASATISAIESDFIESLKAIQSA